MNASEARLKDRLERNRAESAAARLGRAKASAEASLWEEMPEELVGDADGGGGRRGGAKLGSRQKCSACGEPGHKARTCLAAKAVQAEACAQAEMPAPDSVAEGGVADDGLADRAADEADFDEADAHDFDDCDGLGGAHEGSS